MAPPLTCVISVSGIRGIVGDTLTPEQVLTLAAAYGVTIAPRGTVVLGRDSRPTGELLAQAVAAGLRGVGCEVVDIGVVPTPTVAIAMGTLGAAGGIQVSASHNPVAWNALKLFAPDGRTLGQAQLDAVLEAYAQPPRWLGWAGCGGYRRDDRALEAHLARVLACVDAERIRARRFRVLIDSVNGAGSVLGPRLLAALGCEVVPVHCRPDLPFPRDPEPTAANLGQTCGLVGGSGAHLGVVQDPDADRLALIDDGGSYIGEEYTLVLCAAGRLAQLGAQAQGATLVANLSTSRMLEDVAARHGARVVRTRVGEAHVVEGMRRHQAVIGGEGNGGVIDPRVVWGRDSHIGMALVLESLAVTGAPLSEAVAAIPRYAMHKEKVALDRAGVARAADTLASHALAQGATIDRQDGIKLSWSDRWLHLRASGTEPVSRIIAEAPSAPAANALAQRVREAIGASPVSIGAHG